MIHCQGLQLNMLFVGYLLCCKLTLPSWCSPLCIKHVSNTSLDRSHSQIYHIHWDCLEADTSSVAETDALLWSCLIVLCIAEIYQSWFELPWPCFLSSWKFSQAVSILALVWTEIPWHAALQLLLDMAFAPQFWLASCAVLLVVLLVMAIKCQYTYVSS